MSRGRGRVSHAGQPRDGHVRGRLAERELTEHVRRDRAGEPGQLLEPFGVEPERVHYPDDATTPPAHAVSCLARAIVRPRHTGHALLAAGLHWHIRSCTNP